MQSWVNSNLSHEPALSFSLSPPRSLFHSISLPFPSLPQPPPRSRTLAVPLPISLSLSPVPSYPLSYLTHCEEGEGVIKGKKKDHARVMAEQILIAVRLDKKSQRLKLSHKIAHEFCLVLRRACCASFCPLSPAPSLLLFLSGLSRNYSRLKQWQCTVREYFCHIGLYKKLLQLYYYIYIYI